MTCTNLTCSNSRRGDQRALLSRSGHLPHQGSPKSAQGTSRAHERQRVEQREIPRREPAGQRGNLEKRPGGRTGPVSSRQIVAGGQWLLILRARDCFKALPVPVLVRGDGDPSGDPVGKGRRHAGHESDGGRVVGAHLGRQEHDEQDIAKAGPAGDGVINPIAQERAKAPMHRGSPLRGRTPTRSAIT